jgi:caa(3)-type oxidase subunit IV
MNPAHKLSTLFGVYFSLLALLVLTAAAREIPSGMWSAPLSLAIATAKTALIFIFFMNLRYQRGLIRIFALAGFFWLAIAGVLTFADYFTRNWRM